MNELQEKGFSTQEKKDVLKRRRAQSIDTIIVAMEAAQKVVSEGFVFSDAQRRASFLWEKSKKEGLTDQEQEELITLPADIDEYLKEYNRVFDLAWAEDQKESIADLEAKNGDLTPEEEEQLRDARLGVETVEMRYKK